MVAAKLTDSIWPVKLSIASAMEMENESDEKKWRPIGKVLRRVAGVLVEKAKTTPDIYPMTINAITTAANQKSNRSPQMQLTHDDVDEALEQLRELGAVVEVHSDGRKPKYKHCLYEWLDVEKVEIAVMAELLLRGQQSLGDLRARASRMEKIEGLTELKPIVRQLVDQGLVIELTPPGRGQLVTHSLYKPEELAKIERELGSATSSDAVTSAPTGELAVTRHTDADELAALKAQVEQLTREVAEIKQTLQLDQGE